MYFNQETILQVELFNLEQDLSVQFLPGLPVEQDLLPKPLAVLSALQEM
jgi:hypothetical protein